MRTTRISALFNQIKNNRIMKTYDVHFNNSEYSNNKGFKNTLSFCKQYISANNGTDNSYFEDYKGGIVSIVCNETEEVVYEIEVK